MSEKPFIVENGKVIDIDVDQIVDEINAQVLRSKFHSGTQMTNNQLLGEIYSLFWKLNNAHYWTNYKSFIGGEAEIHVYKTTTVISVDYKKGKEEYVLDALPKTLLVDIYVNRFNILKNLKLHS